MPVPSQRHYGFHSFPVVDWFCLFIYLWVLTFPLLDCSEFGNFVITLIYYNIINKAFCYVLRGSNIVSIYYWYFIKTYHIEIQTVYDFNNIYTVMYYFTWFLRMKKMQGYRRFFSLILENSKYLEKWWTICCLIIVYMYFFQIRDIKCFNLLHTY